MVLYYGTSYMLCGNLYTVEVSRQADRIPTIIMDVHGGVQNTSTLLIATNHQLQYRTEQNRTEQDRTVQDSTEQYGDRVQHQQTE